MKAAGAALAQRGYRGLRPRSGAVKGPSRRGMGTQPGVQAGTACCKSPWQGLGAAGPVPALSCARRVSFLSLSVPGFLRAG